MSVIECSPPLPNISEVVNDSIMSGQPNLIVEGASDLRIYYKLSDVINMDCVVRPIELIEGYNSGCENVIRFFKELQSKEELINFIKGNILGVIDKDVRDFRNEIPESDNIVTLDQYSIESYFFCEETVLYCLGALLKIKASSGLNHLSTFLYQKILDNCGNLYIASIDALRKSLDADYDNIFCYGDKFEKLKNKAFLESLYEREDLLKVFAEENGISFNEECIKKIVKGKVLIQYFYDEFCSEVRKIENDCQSHLFPRCIYCRDGYREQCLYKQEFKINKQSVMMLVSSFFPVKEFEDLSTKIKDKLKGC